MASNPLLDVVNDGLNHSFSEGLDIGYIEGFEAGANAMRCFIMQGDPTVPQGEYDNPHDIVAQMRKELQ